MLALLLANLLTDFVCWVCGLGEYVEDESDPMGVVVRWFALGGVALGFVLVVNVLTAG